MSDYNYKAVNRDLGRAIHQYGMIAPGDRILVGVSGGKDSLSLMWMLAERLPRIPVDYRLEALYVDPGFEDGFAGELQKWCESIGFFLHVEYTDNGVIAHSEENRENPCFLCARRRRQRIFEFADRLGCNKIALGHHKDDILETFFINMCYTGVMSTMQPVQPMFGGRFTIIRPLSLVDEERLKRLASDMGFPRFTNPCPSAQTSKRREIKSAIQTITRGKKKIKNNIFRSLSHVRLDYMLGRNSAGH